MLKRLKANFQIWGEKKKNSNKINLIQIKLLVNFQTSRAFFNKPRGDLLLLVPPLSENGECIICFAWSIWSIAKLPD